ncbi:MAG: hypothetical protein MJ240_01250 [Kiritimatiellae bacterium]|nr:hypothetical protein [Kiritimatiellia bacterium]
MRDDGLIHDVDLGEQMLPCYSEADKTRPAKFVKLQELRSQAYRAGCAAEIFVHVLESWRLAAATAEKIRECIDKDDLVMIPVSENGLCDDGYRLVNRREALSKPVRCLLMAPFNSTILYLALPLMDRMTDAGEDALRQAVAAYREAGCALLELLADIVAGPCADALAAFRDAVDITSGLILGDLPLTVPIEWEDGVKAYRAALVKGLADLQTLPAQAVPEEEGFRNAR